MMRKNPKPLVCNQADKLEVISLRDDSEASVWNETESDFLKDNQVLVPRNFLEIR